VVDGAKAVLGTKNSDDFFDIVDKHSHVKGIVFGHIHQEFFSIRKTISLFGSPSTGLQFTPGTKEVAISNESPAYRILNLHSDGKIETEVVRVSQ
ncbi:MAG: phosphodiesterase, partial [Magnetococcales bacterium]|nr:phosphodiesterase [Magnetococcales bacterium]